MARVNDIMSLLTAQLKLVLPSTYTFTAGSNSGNPTLSVWQSSTETVDEENVFIQLTQKSYSGFPTASLASNVDGRPDLLQLAFEAADAAAPANTIGWTGINLSKLLSVCASMNVEMEIYVVADDTVPVLASIDPANLMGRVLADPRHPNVGM